MDQVKRETKKISFADEIKELLKNNIRDYAMYIAMVIIFVFFGIGTDGRFLSSRNISDLINQTGYVAVLAIGMTVILIIRHIDLSVGYVAGFLGAIAAILLKNGVHVGIAIPAVLLIGIIIGIYQGVLVAYIKVPAFVVTLAGMFIFRGLLSLITAGSGTIIVKDETFKAISNGYIPDIMSGNFHVLTVVIGLIGICMMIYYTLKNRSNLLKYNFHVNSTAIYTTKILAFSGVIFTVVWVLAGYKGIPWTAIIVGIVLAVYNFILNKTKTGRYVYGIGGNEEAAALSGINVKKITLMSFASVSMMAALAGILYTSRLASATPTAGLGFELDAIAASYIGGVSVSGGVGRVTNTIIGALVIMSLTNGMNLMGINVSYQYVVKGIIFIIAVAFDIRTRKV